MATYSDDFSGNSPVGPAPTGWTSRWVTTGVTYTTVADSDAEGGVCLRYNVTVDGRHLITFDAVDSESPDNRDDCEILVKYKTADVTGDYMLGAVGRASGAAATETGYTLRQYGYYELIYPTRFSSGTGTNLYTSLPGGTQPSIGSWHYRQRNNQWCWIRARMNGSNLYMKMWAENHIDGNTGQYYWEPDDWSYQYTDGSPITAAGWIGLNIFDAGWGACDIAYFSVGTNGDAAPYPRTNSQTMYLSQQGVEVLATMANAEIACTQQTVQILVQENPPAASNPKRNIVIGM